MKAYAAIFLASIYFTLTSGSKLPGNSIEPGRYCDPALYDELVRPSTEALHKLYKEVETEKQIAAAISFGVAARNMQRNLHALIQVPDNELNQSAYKKREGDQILSTKACLGLVASYMTCDAEQSACVCKNEFPFNFTLENGRCVGLPGSICAVDKSFVLPCTQGTFCELAGIKSMRFCGGIPEYKKAQTAALAEDAMQESAAPPQPPAVPEQLEVQKPQSDYPVPSRYDVPPRPSPVELEREAVMEQENYDQRSPTVNANANLDTENEIQDLRTKLNELSQALNSNSEKLYIALQKIEQLEGAMGNITKKFEDDRLSYELHKHRIILLGVPEDNYETDESLRARVESLVNSEDLNVQGVMCGKLQRLGAVRGDGRPRAVKINYCF